jgi:tetratricopeptide (TPR) repeat protein
MAVGRFPATHFMHYNIPPFPPAGRRLLLLPALAFLLAVLFTACRHEAPKKEQPSENLGGELLDQLNRRIMENSSNPDLLAQRAAYFRDKKQYQNALNDINRALALDSARAGFWMIKADVLFSIVQVPQAMEAFRKVTALDPSNTEAWLKLAEMSMYIREYQSSLDYANAALKVNSKLEKAYFIKGFVYKETHDTARAISSFQTCMEVNPKSYDACMQLGILFAARGNPLALQYYAQALQLRPGSIETLYDRAMYYQEAQEYNRAMEDYSAILKINPKYKEAYFNLGYIHLAYLKVYRQAIRYFSDAIGCDSTYIEAYYNRGMSFESLGDVQNAAVDYKKALAIYPRYQLAQEALERVSK